MQDKTKSEILDASRGQEFSFQHALLLILFLITSTYYIVSTVASWQHNVISFYVYMTFVIKFLMRNKRVFFIDKKTDKVAGIEV